MSSEPERLRRFLRPLWQDLDGISRDAEIERIAAIARRLYRGDDTRALELLLLFRPLGNWLDKVGNLSRTMLATGLGEAELRHASASIKRLDPPETDEEIAVAAAVRIDGAGVRGLAERLARARREGKSVDEVAREGVEEPDMPEWFPADARVMLIERWEKRAAVCREILEEATSRPS